RPRGRRTSAAGESSSWREPSQEPRGLPPVPVRIVVQPEGAPSWLQLQREFRGGGRASSSSTRRAGGAAGELAPDDLLERQAEQIADLQPRDIGLGVRPVLRALLPACGRTEQAAFLVVANRLADLDELGGRVLDLERRVLEAEAVAQQHLELPPDAVAVRPG